MTLIGNNFAFVGAGLGVLAKKNHASSKTRVWPRPPVLCVLVIPVNHPKACPTIVGISYFSAAAGPTPATITFNAYNLIQTAIAGDGRL